MSYCRWSSGDFSCDVYVYESGNGWIIHVAGNRHVGDIPKTPKLTQENIPEYMVAHQAQMDFLSTCKREAITLPHAGESFDFDTPGECADQLEALRALGYHVPQYAIDALREESE